MDDATESDVIYEALTILMRLSTRSIQGFRQDFTQIEFITWAKQTGSTSWTFLPMILVCIV